MKLRRTDRRGLTGNDVMFDLSYARRRGRVIKNNEQTVVVDFIIGCNKHVKIKRHKRKHNVRPINVTLVSNFDNHDIMWESGGAYVEL